jgi:hypothetical protein
MHVHACLLALHTGKPVKMMYSRESFFGHVHRHPARITTSTANGDGALSTSRRHPPDGGAYASSTPWSATLGTMGADSVAPSPNVHRRLRRLPKQPALRGDARIQVGAGGVRLRGTRWISRGSPRHGPLSSAAATPWSSGFGPTDRSSTAPRRSSRCCAASSGCRMPTDGGSVDLRHMPARRQHNLMRASGGASATPSATNVGSPGLHDTRRPGSGWRPSPASRSCPCTRPPRRSSQGLITIEQQIRRTELGVSNVIIVEGHQRRISRSTSASRQTYVTGGRSSRRAIIREHLLKKVAITRCC